MYREITPYSRLSLPLVESLISCDLLVEINYKQCSNITNVSRRLVLNMTCRHCELETVLEIMYQMAALRKAMQCFGEK